MLKRIIVIVLLLSSFIGLKAQNVEDYYRLGKKYFNEKEYKHVKCA